MPHDEDLPPCRRCGWAASVHAAANPDSCDEFMAELRPWIELPPHAPQTPPGSPRQGLNLFDPNTQTIWLVVPEPQWTYAFRLAYQDGRFPLAELRVFPTEEPESPPPPAGDWSGMPSSVPQGGISAKVLRAAPLAETRKQAPTLVRQLRGHMGEQSFQALLASRSLPPDVVKRVGQSPHEAITSRQQQVTAAILYVAEVNAGAAAPVAQVAERMGLARNRVRDLLHDARRNRYLTRSPRGRAGGEITQHAIDFLYALGRTKQEAP